nr:hypothetical protein Iba_scaffold38198CG0040 [Ipomoea batatas]GMD42124.1 hypothetical protein Iba_chr10bCG6320 [Ipomoea batatas]
MANHCRISMMPPLRHHGPHRSRDVSLPGNHRDLHRDCRRHKSTPPCRRATSSDSKLSYEYRSRTPQRSPTNHRRKLAALVIIKTGERERDISLICSHHHAPVRKLLKMKTSMKEEIIEDLEIQQRSELLKTKTPR